MQGIPKARLEFYEVHVNGLPAGKHQAICAALKSQLDKGKAVTSSHLGAQLLSQEPFSALKDAFPDPDTVEKMFGLLLWKTACDHPLKWVFHDDPEFPNNLGKTYIPGLVA